MAADPGSVPMLLSSWGSSFAGVTQIHVASAAMADRGTVHQLV
jgi:hypothetical protein